MNFQVIYKKNIKYYLYYIIISKCFVNTTEYEESSHEIEEKLLEAQELNRILSVYKNQEYPEKLLQINKLRKELGDLNNLHNEEQQNLQDIINREKEMMKRSRFETTRNITLDISKVRDN